MKQMEKAAQQHARDWLRYDRSDKASMDRLIDRQQRASKDRAVGHSPNCTLTKCAADCPKLKK